MHEVAMPLQYFFCILFFAQDEPDFDLHISARCRFPGHPNNGHIACASPNLLDGEKCRVVCDRGHYVSGEKEAVCKNGQWTATLGSCEGVYFVH